MTDVRSLTARMENSYSAVGRLQNHGAELTYSSLTIRFANRGFLDPSIYFEQQLNHLTCFPNCRELRHRSQQPSARTMVPIAARGRLPTVSTDRSMPRPRADTAVSVTVRPAERGGNGPAVRVPTPVARSTTRGVGSTRFGKYEIPVRSFSRRDPGNSPTFGVRYGVISRPAATTLHRSDDHPPIDGDGDERELSIQEDPAESRGRTNVEQERRPPPSNGTSPHERGTGTDCTDRCRPF